MSKLNHILTFGKHGRDHQGLDYQNKISSNYNIVFMKPSHIEPIQQNICQGNTLDLYSSNFQGKAKMFVPNYHFCNIKVHIRPSCFKFMKFLRNNI